MEDSLKELVQRSKAGNGDAKKELLTRIKPLVIATIRKYYFGQEELEDLIQEGYLRTLQELQRFQLERGIPFLGYIKLHLKYFFMDRGKKHKMEMNFALKSSVTEEGIRIVELLADEKVDVQKKLLKTEEQLELSKKLNALNPRQRQIIALFYGRGLSMRAIAKMLGLHYQTVVKTRDRALEILRKNYL